MKSIRKLPSIFFSNPVYVCVHSYDDPSEYPKRIQQIVELVYTTEACIVYHTSSCGTLYSVQIMGHEPILDAIMAERLSEKFPSEIKHGIRTFGPGPDCPMYKIMFEISATNEDVDNLHDDLEGMSRAFKI